MMGLDNADKRRALRSIVQAIVAFVLLYFVWEWTKRLDVGGLRLGMQIALGIVAISTIGYAFENSLRALKLSANRDGITAEVDGGEQ